MSDPMQHHATQCNKRNSLSANAARNREALNNLTPRQAKAVELLLHGCADAEIAKCLHVDRTTIFRWRKKNPHFRTVLLAAQRGLHQRALDRLRTMVNPALTILRQELENPLTALQAATTLLRVARVHNDLDPNHLNDSFA